jgi:iron complex outermembrane receptor protein
VAENRHRTHAVIGALRGSHGLGDGGSVTAGVEGGADWIRSSNLGNHAMQRVSAFGEWRHALAAEAQIDASVRVDRYSEFGAAWSPAVGVGWWPVSMLRLRGSAGRAFRVPTFTERYYSDPAHLARSEIAAETAWAAETGADLVLPAGWMFAATLFGRMDADVIDWLRPTVADRWRTYNIRDVDTLGVELTARKVLADGWLVQAGYTGLDVRAAAVRQLSKYVLDYAPHSVGLAASLVLPGAIQLAPRLEYRRRTRSIGTDDYTVADVRVSRRVGLYEVRVEGTNLGDAQYQEILGVAMPGRAVSLSLAIGR